VKCSGAYEYDREKKHSTKDLLGSFLQGIKGFPNKTDNANKVYQCEHDPHVRDVRRRTPDKSKDARIDIEQGV